MSIFYNRWITIYICKKKKFNKILSRSVAGRTLLTSQFMSSHKLEPVGLSWCQVEWDESVSETCRQLAGN